MKDPHPHSTHGHDDEPPTLDEYLKAAQRLATLVRRALDNPKSVNTGAMRRALEAFERVDYKAM